MALGSLIALTHLWKVHECLGTVVDTLHRFTSSFRIVLRDVLENVLEPPKRFVGPVYLRHERMRCAICSLEMTLPASESAQASAHHYVKCELADDLLRRTILGLLLNEAGQFFLSRRHAISLHRPTMLPQVER